MVKVKTLGSGFMWNDHCDALYKIYKRGKLGESYNVGSNTNIKNINLIKLIINIFKKKRF